MNLQTTVSELELELVCNSCSCLVSESPLHVLLVEGLYRRVRDSIFGTGTGTGTGTSERG